jgi:methyltransferase (TIGR00027 family)
MTRSAAIAHVTDTAFWVGALRANETKRPDGVFHDPLAALVAGTRGEKIARAMPDTALVQWGVVVRTSAIDRLIGEALNKGVDTVVNLGAGLDTRPYRMTLPAQTRWIEIDFPSMVRWKDEVLAGQKAVCGLERIGLDLSDRAARSDVFKVLGSTSGKTLLIAEGVMPYLSNEAVADLAKELAGIPTFCYWILDFDNAGARRTPKSWAKQLKAAPFLFQPGDWFRFFAGCGWQQRTVISSAEESDKLNKPYPFVFPQGLLMRVLPREVRRRILSVSGAALLTKNVAPTARP